MIGSNFFCHHFIISIIHNLLCLLYNIHIASAEAENINDSSKTMFWPSSNIGFELYFFLTIRFLSSLLLPKCFTKYLNFFLHCLLICLFILLTTKSINNIQIIVNLLYQSLLSYLKFLILILPP